MLPPAPKKKAPSVKTQPPKTVGGIDSIKELIALVLSGYVEIPHRLGEERVSARTLAPKGVDCKIPHWLEMGTKHSL